jgi:hypothetical protein
MLFFNGKNDLSKLIVRFIRKCIIAECWILHAINKSGE